MRPRYACEFTPVVDFCTNVNDLIIGNDPSPIASEAELALFGLLRGQGGDAYSR
jgi:hypothetical protein